ncbi:type I-F CRISPR-associated endoribonuclease Cas6/Csy4 [Halodesulfovibrio sp.]|jgi:CRISPR-associated endonuclease Csy4|uniref:type I-F CRISPR-associated endoribonuclease Cas6/Csy4 n=1 Tax=Halodesulfovibrio sp. TaxID=1912772 RepID=UPI0025E44B8D|nr:type I-F CRISPR-associated endoribonuclease Cas6/Csy4 [Halodesulfovibrio sp.]MCT4627550.1 type I-F CRISPR-associated endoribonuclease Cas6/Csy4 [Halodesulfovibrio sp.]
MDYYLDFTVLPDLEFSSPMLMNNLFAKLHRQIGAYGEKQIGVSFPEVTACCLGAVLRLHGTQQKLELLLCDNWMKGLRDYVEQSSIKPVPKDTVRYRTVRRVQKKSAHNKRKRSVAKGWLTEEAAQEAIQERGSDMLTHPYIQLRSLSTNSMMRIYIAHGAIQKEAVSGAFSSYGLSSTATIPWF